EGESYKELTVVSIDSENGRVRIKNGDTEMVLDFIKNGVKPPAVSAMLPANTAPSLAMSNPTGRAVVAGPAPVSTLPPAILARLQQRLLEQQQGGQTEQGQQLIAPLPTPFPPR